MLQAEFLSVIDASRCVGKVRFRRLKRAIERPMRAGYDDRGGTMSVWGDGSVTQEPPVRLTRMRASQKRITRGFKTSQRPKGTTGISPRTDEICPFCPCQVELSETQPIVDRSAGSESQKKGVNKGFPAQKRREQSGHRLARYGLNKTHVDVPSTPCKPKPLQTLPTKKRPRRAIPGSSYRSKEDENTHSSSKKTAKSKREA